jgi:hypothetical protein
LRGAHAIVPVGFEVVEERADQGRVQIGNLHIGGCFRDLVRDESHQQLDRVPVGSDRVATGLPLAAKAIGEE